MMLFGARIRKSESGSVTNYYYSQGSVLYTEDGNGKGTSLNLQGISGNVIATAREENGTEGYYYYHKNLAKSTTNLRSADGTSIVSYQYTDFGETSSYGDTDFYNEICYNGAIYDKSTGLYYLSARYYDPEDGRFLTRDSYRRNAANANTWHLYVYCANNPVNYEDPSGHVPVWTIIKGIAGGAVGGIVGYAAGKAIAKKTNAKGWKKVAIIAGCTVAGGAVGAVVAIGPKKVMTGVKKLASAAKNRLANKTTLKTMKSTTQKVKSVAGKTGSKTKQVVSNQNVKQAFKQDAKGRWHRLNGQFASKSEVEGVKSVLNKSIHGNSLSNPKTNYGYALVEKGTNQILKFGETLYPNTRYSQKFLESINATMKILEQGSKSDIHYWQHDMNMYYFDKYNGYPPLNKGGW